MLLLKKNPFCLIREGRKENPAYVRQQISWLVQMVAMMPKKVWLDNNKGFFSWVEAGQDDYIKEMCSPESLLFNLASLWLDRSALLLHSNQKERSLLILKLLRSWKYYWIFFNGLRNNKYLQHFFWKSYLECTFA